MDYRLLTLIPQIPRPILAGLLLYREQRVCYKTIQRGELARRLLVTAAWIAGKGQLEVPQEIRKAVRLFIHYLVEMHFECLTSPSFLEPLRGFALEEEPKGLVASTKKSTT